MPHLDDRPDDLDDVAVITVVSPLTMDYTAVGCPVSNRRRWQWGQLLLLTANSTELLATNIAGDAWPREPRRAPPSFCLRALDESNWLRGHRDGCIHRGSDAQQTFGLPDSHYRPPPLVLCVSARTIM
jgi:hypothetical protein